MSYFTIHLSFNLLVKEFLNGKRLAQLQAKWLIVRAPHSPCSFVLKDAELN